MLTITAELENLTNLQPQGGCDDPDFTYYFKVFLSISSLCFFFFFFIPEQSHESGFRNAISKLTPCRERISILYFSVFCFVFLASNLDDICFFSVYFLFSGRIGEMRELWRAEREGD